MSAAVFPPLLSLLVVLLVASWAPDALAGPADALAPLRAAPAGAPWPTREWVVAANPLPGVHGVRLAATVNAAFAEADPGRLRRTRAVVVIHGNRIVAERYAPGFCRETRLPGWSMTKSVTNALVGILVRAGKLSLREPADVPEWRAAGDRRGAITVDHLLRMSSGLKYLRDGVWDGRRILPEGWVDYTRTPTAGAPKGEYGAHFWLNAGVPSRAVAPLMPKVPRDAFFAWGLEHQYVMIVPSRDLVVVRLGLTTDWGAFDDQAFFADVVAAFPARGE